MDRTNIDSSKWAEGEPTSDRDLHLILKDVGGKT